jgi:hypothetical protein
MAFVPALLRGFRTALLKLLAFPVATGALFGLLRWLLLGESPKESWFLPAAVTLAVASVLICSALGETAFAQNRSRSLRVGYHLLGPTLPAAFVLLLGKAGVLLSIAALALVLFILPLAHERPTNEA